MADMSSNPGGSIGNHNSNSGQESILLDTAAFVSAVRGNGNVGDGTLAGLDPITGEFFTAVFPNKPADAPTVKS